MARILCYGHNYIGSNPILIFPIETYKNIWFLHVFLKCKYIALNLPPWRKK